MLFVIRKDHITSGGHPIIRAKFLLKEPEFHVPGWFELLEIPLAQEFPLTLTPLTWVVGKVSGLTFFLNPPDMSVEIEGILIPQPKGMSPGLLTGSNRFFEVIEGLDEIIISLGNPLLEPESQIHFDIPDDQLPG